MSSRGGTPVYISPAPEPLFWTFRCFAPSAMWARLRGKKKGLAASAKGGKKEAAVPEPALPRIGEAAIDGLLRCVQFLRQQGGVGPEGVFRIPGDEDQISAVYDAILAGAPNGIEHLEPSIEATADAIKRVMRNHSAIIPAEGGVCAAFIDWGTNAGDAAKLRPGAHIGKRHARPGALSCPPSSPGRPRPAPAASPPHATTPAVPRACAATSVVSLDPGLASSPPAYGP